VNPDPAPYAPWTLRRAQADDAPAFVRMMAEPTVFGGLLQLPYPAEALWRERLGASPSAGSPDLHLVAVVDGEVIGSAGLHAASHVRRRHVMGLGLSVSLPWQRQGVGRALLGALCDYADRWTGALRLELTVYTDNAAAIALYRCFGFEAEGTHRGFALRDGAYVDALAMARLHPNPPRIGSAGAA
jgi:L-phenylalanine/L-methionine N-acetyltransferase